MDQPQTAAARYETLAVDRQPFLDRARDCSKFTIPSLIPPEGHTGMSKLVTPHQSIGARGVNNLAAKLLLALLPPSASFFRLTMDEAKLLEAKLQEGDREKLEEALAQYELTVVKSLEQRGTRVQAFEAFKHLIVGGNVLLHHGKKSIRVFPLSQFVVKRDPEGTVLEIVVKECVSPAALPASIREHVKEILKQEAEANKTEPAKTVDIYTHVTREESGGWRVVQEVKGQTIPESEGSYPAEKSPWLPLRWTRIDGENYGRGLCEEYLGDLVAAEGLSQTLLEGSAAAARVLFLVNPNGMTRQEVLAEAPNLAIREGVKDDVGVVGLEKSHDFSVAKASLDDVKQSLSYAFLLNSAVQRNAERVTAEEIRYVANELEQALGGAYSVLSAEFQLPLVSLLIAQLEKETRLPVLPKEIVSPTIVTGIDALGRNQELMRLDAFIGGVQQTFGPEAVARHVNINTYLSRRAAALGVNTKGLLTPPEVLAQQDQQAQMQAMAEKLGPAAIGAGAKIATAPSQIQEQPTE